ncbi:MAG: hypothetical protein F6J89_19530 [Symploca sp. SIO1C4]|uniref:Uncharacterized protein n=1 Tax=Symploca sp. SIO1C4 TaxID=2607765 RepID=A0A6B3NIA2_9CYAN|nr:hypothetical protein [Symploca sp. SIO1C4]
MLLYVNKCNIQGLKLSICGNGVLSDGQGRERRPLSSTLIYWASGFSVFATGAAGCSRSSISLQVSFISRDYWHWDWLM